MNVNGATYRTKHPNQFSHGQTDHQLLAMITMLARSKTFVKTASVWVSNTAVENRIRSPVVYKVLNASAMEHVGI